MTTECDPDLVFEECKDDWYDVSKQYWEKQEKSDFGMLAGFVKVSAADIYESRDLIEKYQNKFKLGNTRAADCGSGIGRVAHLCLMDYFQSIDLIDPIPAFLDTAEKKLKDFPIRKFPVGIQDWEPDTQYDIFWCQWSIMYLTDVDCISFLRRCKQHLSPNGIIVIKDNISDQDLNAGKETCQFDLADHGISRAYKHYIQLFKDAGLNVLETVKQSNYPKNLLPLYFFVLN